MMSLSPKESNLLELFQTAWMRLDWLLMRSMRDGQADLPEKIVPILRRHAGGWNYFQALMAKRLHASYSQASRQPGLEVGGRYIGEGYSGEISYTEYGR